MEAKKQRAPKKTTPRSKRPWWEKLRRGQPLEPVEWDHRVPTDMEGLAKLLEMFANRALAQRQRSRAVQQVLEADRTQSPVIFLLQEQIDQADTLAERLTVLAYDVRRAFCGEDSAKEGWENLAGARSDVPNRFWIKVIKAAEQDRPAREGGEYPRVHDERAELRLFQKGGAQ